MSRTSPLARLYELGLTTHTPLDVSGNLPSTGYDPIQVEAAHYEWWSQKGFFQPRYKENGDPLDKGVFSIILPPPNVTGNLHIGHALTIAIEDALVRW